MARLHGRAGQLYLGIASDTASASALPFGVKWSLNAATDKVEVTAFGDSNKTYVSGLPDAQGSFEAWYDDATAQTWTAASDGLARRFYLYPKAATTAGPYWFGTAVFDFNLDVGVEDAVKCTGSFSATSIVSKVG